MKNIEGLISVCFAHVRACAVVLLFVLFGGCDNTVSTAKATSIPVAVGETFALGDFTYQIKTVSKVIGPLGDILGEPDDRAGVKLTFSVTNSGKKAETISISRFSLEDEKGRKFEPHDHENNSGIGGKRMKEMIPGIKEEGKLGFFVPLEVFEGTLELVIRKGGFSSINQRVKLIFE